MHGLTPTQMQKITTQYNLAKAILDKVEEELEKVIIKVYYLCKQRCLWAEKIACAVYRGIEIINKLNWVEAEEAKAKCTRIAE